MVRKNELLGIIAVALVCLLFIVYSQHGDTSYPHPSYHYEPMDYRNSFHNNFSYVTIEEAVNQVQNVVRRETIDYEFPNGTTLTDYTLADGGQPIRSVILATWRTGSTFLGAVMNSLPGNFYHYEPLLDYEIIQIRGSPHAESALKVLKKLLSCDYADLNRYLSYGMQHTYLFTHNIRLWNVCKVYPMFCWNADFLSQLCKVFPFQSMKVVRMRLKLAEELLKDPSLNIKVVLLIRDPRGIMQSRRHRDWCPGAPDCDDPALVCADMVSDYSAAIRLKKLYPERFRTLRYEELSTDPYKYVQSLFKFFGLNFHWKVKEFLDTHTKSNYGGVSSTFRDSKMAPFHWKNDLIFSEVEGIQERCGEAMKLWGYLKATDRQHLKEFYPITNYTLQTSFCYLY